MEYGAGPGSAIDFYPIDATEVDELLDYSILEAPNNKRFKIYLLAALIASVYNQYYLTSPDILQVKLFDVVSHKDLTKRFTVLSNNYRINIVNCDLQRDRINFDLSQVA